MPSIIYLLTTLTCAFNCQACWAYEVENRPTFDLLQHRFHQVRAQIRNMPRPLAQTHTGGSDHGEASPGAHPGSVPEIVAPHMTAQDFESGSSASSPATTDQGVSLHPPTGQARKGHGKIHVLTAHATSSNSQPMLQPMPHGTFAKSSLSQNSVVHGVWPQARYINREHGAGWMSTGTILPDEAGNRSPRPSRAVSPSRSDCGRGGRCRLVHVPCV